VLSAGFLPIFLSLLTLSLNVPVLFRSLSRRFYVDLLRGSTYQTISPVLTVLFLKNPKCEYPNIIKPIAFLVWHNDGVRNVVLKELGVDPKSLPSVITFSAWASRSADLDASLPNIFELILMYHKLREAQQLPTVTLE
jgi:hypothetical protein